MDNTIQINSPAAVFLPLCGVAKMNESDVLLQAITLIVEVVFNYLATQFTVHFISNTVDFMPTDIEENLALADSQGELTDYLTDLDNYLTDYDTDTRSSFDLLSDVDESDTEDMFF